jgi:hypothetical protein
LPWSASIFSRLHRFVTFNCTAFLVIVSNDGARCRHGQMVPTSLGGLGGKVGTGLCVFRATKPYRPTPADACARLLPLAHSCAEPRHRVYRGTNSTFRAESDPLHTRSPGQAILDELNKFSTGSTGVYSGTDAHNGCLDEPRYHPRRRTAGVPPEDFEPTEWWAFLCVATHRCGAP